MKHKIDLSKYNVRTDLISELIERKEVNGVSNTTLKYDDIYVTSTNVSENNDAHDLFPGRYITISFDDTTDTDSKSNLEEVFSESFKQLLEDINIDEKESCLIVGLGNEGVTADSLGPKVVKNTLITKHLFDIPEIDVLSGYRNVSSITPGVMGNTGIETSKIVEAVTSSIKPDFVIVIDALCAADVKRLNKTIQISTSGIKPGSGVKNERKEISSRLLGVPVIAIGVPTVTSGYSICKDAVDKLLSVTKISKDDDLVTDVLYKEVGNLIVSVKEIDTIIEDLVEIISNGLNDALHRQIT